MECPICEGDFVEEMGGRGFEDRFRPPRWMAMGSGGDESFAAFYENFDMDAGTGMRFERGMMMPPRAPRRRRPDHHHHHHHMQMVEAVNALMSHLHRSRDAESSRGRIPQFRERIPHPLTPASDHMLLLRGPMDGGVELFIPRNRRYTLDEVMEQLSQQFPESGRCGPPPASRSAVDAMPTVRIAEKHLCIESHCAVCTDEFEIGGEAREMPCKHIYHADCILPWLAQHNSCPVCRHEMPTDDESNGRQSARSSTEQEPSTSQSQEPSASQSHVGLTIWGLPGGGYAVGRFSTPPVGRSSSSSVIFNRGLGGSDPGNNTSGESQGRRNPFSFLWPFRSSNSSQESSSTSTSDHHARRWFG